MNRTQKSFLSSGTVIVPAGAVVPYYCTGQMFICKESSGAFWMSFDDGEFFKHEVGLGFRLKGEDQFSKLQFRNDSASAITIEFYAGVGEVMDNRLNTVIDRLMIVGLKDVPDYSKGTNAVGSGLPTLADGATSAAISGTDPVTGKQRKQIVIFNGHASANLFVLDSSNNFVGVIGAGQSWTLHSAATLKLYNWPGSGTISYALGQTFYNS
jgi:hypothetical protein